MTCPAGYRLPRAWAFQWDNKLLVGSSHLLSHPFENFIDFCNQTHSHLLYKPQNGRWGVEVDKLSWLLFRISKIYHKPIVLVIYCIFLQYPLHANSMILPFYLVKSHISLSLSCWLCHEIPMIWTFFPTPTNTCLNPITFQDASPVPPLPRSIT